ncbi:MAG: carboxylating nicotinate-nucleotide diphosphorylase [Firmicutes bacterium]|nr:carboxylating nicotinate-nucleotide diphosphorylase [Bacillota bacterium]
MILTPWAREIMELALKEDIGGGDYTTSLIVPPEKVGDAEIITREDGVIAGLEVCKGVFKMVDERIDFNSRVTDGDSVSRGAVIAEIDGPVQPIMMAERTALNFLQRLSGIATLTRIWTERIKNHAVFLLDTRKTSPGLRYLEKYAVMVGGGRNHRLGLSGGIVIKENHIAAAGGISAAVKRAVMKAPITLKIEVEVTDLDEFREALDAGADLIMLDNMDPETIREAVKINAGRVLLEASGDISEARLEEYARTGVDFISSGALTHSFKSLNLSLLTKNIDQG